MPMAVKNVRVRWCIKARSTACLVTGSELACAMCYVRLEILSGLVHCRQKMCLEKERAQAVREGSKKDVISSSALHCEDDPVRTIVRPVQWFSSECSEVTRSNTLQVCYSSSNRIVLVAVLVCVLCVGLISRVLTHMNAENCAL